MALDLHGRSCTVLLSQGRTGYGLILLLGTLRVAGGAVWILPKEGGDAVLVPPHLAGEIEPITDELRERVERQLDSELCLRAYRPGGIRRKAMDWTKVLAESSGPSTTE